MNQKISLTVNGQNHQLEVLARRLLLDCLRYDLGFTGTKEGCSVGVCGACTVLLDGKMVSSCLILAVMANGSEVTTVEGLDRDGELDAIQQAFITYGGFQCGACTSGQLMAARELLNTNSNPSEEEIKDWMFGNLCRCTGYYKILESVQMAAKTEQQG